MAYLSRCLSLSETAMQYDREAESLAHAIRTHCWDPRDRFYYSVDLNLRPVEKPRVDGVSPADLFLHVGQPRQYDCLIQRFSVWSGFMALWAGIATPQQAQEIVARQYLDTTLFCCPAGVRSLSPLEKTYNTKASGNPLVVAGAGMDMCQLSRLPWAPQVRIHRRGASPGMEDNHTPRQGF